MSTISNESIAFTFSADTQNENIINYAVFQVES